MYTASTADYEIRFPKEMDCVEVIDNSDHDPLDKVFRLSENAAPGFEIGDPYDVAISNEKVIEQINKHTAPLTVQNVHMFLDSYGCPAISFEVKLPAIVADYADLMGDTVSVDLPLYLE